MGDTLSPAGWYRGVCSDPCHPVLGQLPARTGGEQGCLAQQPGNQTAWPGLAEPDGRSGH